MQIPINLLMSLSVNCHTEHELQYLVIRLNEKLTVFNLTCTVKVYNDTYILELLGCELS